MVKLVQPGRCGAETPTSVSGEWCKIYVPELKYELDLVFTPQDPIFLNHGPPKIVSVSWVTECENQQCESVYVCQTSSEKFWKISQGLSTTTRHQLLIYYLLTKRILHLRPQCVPYSLPVSLQVNLALGSHILLVPSQSFSSLPSSQSLSPSHLQRSGMQVPSATQWNSSPLHSITDGSTETKVIQRWLFLAAHNTIARQRHDSNFTRHLLAFANICLCQRGTWQP